MVVVGEPSERWRRAATVALGQLARLRLGRARIVDQAVSIEGEARDVVVQAAIKDLIGRSLPEGYGGSETIVVRSDAMIAAEQTSQRKAEDESKRAELESEKQRLAAMEAARQRDEATAKQRADAGTEANQRDEAEAEARRQQIRRHAEEESGRRSAEEAARVREATAARQRDEIDARQRAAQDARRRVDEAELQRRADEVAKLQRDTEARRAQLEQEKARVQAQADACGSELQKLAKEGVIRFDWASARLDRRSYATLDKLAEAARICPEGIIEVEGHTDAEGIDERNLPLSERRAQAVLNFLIKAGVPTERIKAVGYGSSRPVAPNDTAANRARNRRIEFTVKPK